MKIWIFPLALVVSGSAVAQSTFAVHSGDRVVFYGDSITDSSQYPNFIETLILTRYPGMDVRFYNSGVGGDRVTGGWMGSIGERLPRDLFAYRPTVFTIMLGMNDASYRAMDAGVFNTYKSGFEGILAEIKKNAPSARGWLIRPSPYDDVTYEPKWKPGYNDVLIQYGELVAELASKNVYGVVDLNKPVVDTLTAANAIDPKTAQKIIPDRVHPGNAGHFVMAWNVFKAWGGTGVLSETEINASAGTSVGKGVKLSQVTASANGVKWTALGGGLPFSFDRNDATVSLVLKATKIDEEVNKQIIKVSGLASGQYRLKIDDSTVGTYSAEDLAIGINIGNLTTPYSKQSALVNSLTWKRAEVQKTWWREIQFKYRDQNHSLLKGAVAGMRKLEEGVIKEQKAAAQPKPHTFELVKA